MHTNYVPYTKLFLHDVHSLALLANGHIQVLDSSTGSIRHSTTTNAELSEKVQKSGQIVAAAVDEGFKYLVTATGDKSIRTWEVEGLRVVSEREALKKPTDICLTRDAETILVSDKFGDVHRLVSLHLHTTPARAILTVGIRRYPLLASGKKDVEAEASLLQKSDSMVPSKRRVDESLLLGHVSLLTTLLLTKDEKYIITADRDEHIRVSWYPEAYTIERFCLGHKKFVSALHIPTWDHSLLISGGGDPELKIWNWMEGSLIHNIPITDLVKPFVKVIRRRPARGEGGSDAEGEGSSTKLSSRARRRNKKRQVKGKVIVEPETQSDAEEEKDTRDKKDDMQVDEQEPDESANGSKPEPPSEETAPLLAIQKISTFESSSSRFIIFSAHGATALFYCNFPTSSDESPKVQSVALNHPVLDFTPWSNENEIWVAVDGNRSETASSIPTSGEFIKIVKIVDSELVLSDASSHQALANSLNTTNRLEVSQDSLKVVDLYSALVVLPKNIDADHNAMDDEALLSEANSGQLTGKELGRLKSKKAVLAHQAVISNKREQSGTPVNDRDLKRQKSESEAG
ncbi:uncharacterized protein FOMMEDRAFT_164318 [Fomitiporia mediterranea MF3/22]|uniref:uncharacterized protein n=1 Tax=Fomitiporia mediterranea (strain MF3/22) TaxID=694068 RepID=UPI000440800A|nr:uncharacterized protein FOMMEDRAFT_164318 [Fomitiporia mediterranea MF3/22]EJD07318.1 hypothetical protein FOMMEDRAFT_164318 [Fomitiporia mediterranea MF3/22]